MDIGPNLNGAKVYTAPLGTDLPTAEELELGAASGWTNLGYAFSPARAEEPYRPNRAARRAAARKARRS